MSHPDLTPPARERSPLHATGIATDLAPLAARSIDELDAAICRLSRQLNAEAYRLLTLVRELDDRMGWAKWSFPNCAEWLAWRCGLSLSAAREKVRTAHALRELPAISAAFGDGRLSYSKVRALTRVAQAHNEDVLLAYALEVTAAQVEERCRQIRNVTPESKDDAQRAWQRRSLSVWRDRAGTTLRVTVEVPLADGELIVRALDRAVEAGAAASGPEFGGDGWHAQQADALVAIARAYLGARCGSAASTSPADHYQVVVHVDEAALRGGAGRSDLPLETVKRLACDGSMTVVAENERGAPVAVGRRQRTVSASLKRALWSRDGGCSFPGCGRSRYVDAHHVRHWADGGGTNLENLTLLCSHHHRLLHEGGYRIGRGADGERYFKRPDGRVIPRCGYRTDDTLDDGGETKPSAEVREAPSTYRLGGGRARREPLLEPEREQHVARRSDEAGVAGRHEHPAARDDGTRPVDRAAVRLDVVDGFECAVGIEHPEDLAVGRGIGPHAAVGRAREDHAGDRRDRGRLRGAAAWAGRAQ